MQLMVQRNLMNENKKLTELINVFISLILIKKYLQHGHHYGS